MEKEIIDNVIHKIIQLAREKGFHDFKIEHILINKEDIKSSIAVISDKNQEIYEVMLKNNEIYPALDWNYSTDDDIFKHLENEYEIGFMSLEFHSGIWSSVEDIGIEEFEHKLGMQKYLKYCKDNNIDKKAIDEKINTDVPDIMKYYNEKTDYIKIEDGQVQIPQEKYKRESEVNYIAFCLGYDLLNDRLSQSEVNECDRVYDFCHYLANKFVETDYYKNEWKSTYDNLRNWLEDNKEIIQSEHLCYLGIDNKCILETGSRGTTKVALVERTTEYGKEYIVAFGYKIDDKKLEWDYGYYYDKDLKKAKADFEKVKAGGNLADTFKDEAYKSIEMPKGMEKYYELKEEMEKIIEIENEKEYREYKIECVLIDRNDMKKSYGIAMCYSDISIVDMTKKEVNYIPNAEYTFDIGDDSVFPSLQKGKMEIAYMSMEVHYALWQEIDRYYPEDIKNKKGVQMYIKYCEENNITKEVIDKGINYDKTPDIMNFKEKKIKDKNRETR